MYAPINRQTEEHTGQKHNGNDMWPTTWDTGIKMS